MAGKTGTSRAHCQVSSRAMRMAISTQQALKLRSSYPPTSHFPDLRGQRPCGWDVPACVFVYCSLCPPTSQLWNCLCTSALCGPFSLCMHLCVHYILSHSYPILPYFSLSALFMHHQVLVLPQSPPVLRLCTPLCPRWQAVDHLYGCRIVRSKLPAKLQMHTAELECLMHLWLFCPCLQLRKCCGPRT